MQKGGVGKTTNALHIAAALAERGRRILLWDVDENYGATKILCSSGEKRWTTMEVVTGDCSVNDAILGPADERDGRVDSLPANLDFIPSSRTLQALERSSLPGASASHCLNVHIDEVRESGRYDYIVLDTGPQASATTRSAYLVADYFILSLIPDKQAMGSLPDALRDVMNARRADRNPGLHLLGLVLSCVDRRCSIDKEYEKALEAGFLDRSGDQVKFRTSISTAAAIRNAYRANSLLLELAPAHRVSEQYRYLAEEIEQRIAAHRGVPSRRKREKRAPGGMEGHVTG